MIVSRSTSPTLIDSLAGTIPATHKNLSARFRICGCQTVRDDSTPALHIPLGGFEQLIHLFLLAIQDADQSQARLYATDPHIPAGTGLKYYRDVIVEEKTDEAVVEAV